MMADLLAIFLDVEKLSKSMASECGIMNQPTTHQSKPLILNSHSFQERGCLLCLVLKRMTCLITYALEYGMLILNFFDAIREGDGKCIFRCWKFQLPYLRNDAGSTKYALEALGMMFPVYGLLSPKP